MKCGWRIQVECVGDVVAFGREEVFVYLISNFTREDPNWSPKGLAGFVSVGVIWSLVKD